jgi:hypothetical protein
MQKFVDSGISFWLLVFAVPIAIVWITSYFGHKRTEMIHQERMAAIARGIMPAGTLRDPEEEEHERREEREGTKTPPNLLRQGLFWLCPGLGLVAFSLLSLADLDAGIRLPILGVSIACAGIGAAYLVIYIVENERARPGIQ